MPPSVTHKFARGPGRQGPCLPKPHVARLAFMPSYHQGVHPSDAAAQRSVAALVFNFFFARLLVTGPSLGCSGRPLHIQHQPHLLHQTSSSRLCVVVWTCTIHCGCGRRACRPHGVCCPSPSPLRCMPACAPSGIHANAYVAQPGCGDVRDSV